LNLLKNVKNGIINENPIFVQLLGMCPTLAVTTSALNGLGMGLATTAVLIGSNVVIASLRKLIPNKIRIPVFIVVIATFVTLIDMFMHAYALELYKSLGLFIPLIVVNCLILGRAESYASKNSVVPAIFDAVGMGIGFTLALTVLGMVRELLGSGSLFGASLFADSFEPALIMILPPGAFLALGFLIGFVNFISKKRAA